MYMFNCIWLWKHSGRVQFSVMQNFPRFHERKSFENCFRFNDKNFKRFWIPLRLASRGSEKFRKKEQKSVRSLNMKFVSHFFLTFIFVYIKHHKFLLHLQPKVCYMRSVYAKVSKKFLFWHSFKKSRHELTQLSVYPN